MSRTFWKRLWASLDPVPEPEAPVNVEPPTIGGTPEEGQTLFCLVGVWSGYPRPTYTYQWEADGSDIEGATDKTLELTADLVDAEITCVVTATNSEGSDTAESDPVGPVTAPEEE